MQRAMRRSDEAAGGLDRERQSLLEQLRTAEQVGTAGLAAALWHPADRTSLAVLETCPHLGEHALVAMPPCSIQAPHQPGALPTHPAPCPYHAPCPAAQQVRFQLERAQEGLQRQLLHAEGGIGVMEARLADAQSGATGEA